MTATTHISKARMWPQVHRSGNTTWKVQVGKRNDGKPDIRSFPSESAAETFRDDWNAKLCTGNTNGIADLSNLARAEILAAIAKLKAFNATLPEAIDFFLKHARPERGTISVEDALNTFLQKKQELKRSDAYLRNCKKTYYLPFTRAFAGRMLNDISSAEAEKYISSHKKWGSVTKTSHVNYLRTFYSFFIKKGYARLNPFEKIETPRAVSTNPKTITPQAAQKLLQFALDNDRKAECACMALVFFCGVRVEGEVWRLKWQNIDLDRGQVEIAAGISKNGRRRINKIPDNARAWLKLCQKPKGRIAPNDYLQRMKRLRKKSGVKYPQNAMRHCFASYHIAAHRNSAETAVQMGHPNPTLLYNTYYEMVKPETAKEFWNILPAQIIKAMKQAEKDAKDWKKKREAKEFEELHEFLRQ